ncbi:NAD(P)-binding protein [Myriangium duriaei CBS 260.36]|uniref:NAD(P)-binding protein n=1 Tax=Myriangium duriaei CBS 260.36 TaxID=1168546 RepID=A0A9P4IWK1_9PEZI|nr:NAD(P)-binding protein [Myriangium duriaei CBS 260.36]
MKVLVTGGSGFLGGAVLRALEEAHPDWKLYNLDQRPPSPPTSAKFLQADITIASSVETAILSARPDVIVHTAGVVPNGQRRYSTSPSVRAPTFTINVDGTSNVLSAARKANVSSLVYTSSCTVVSDDLAHDYPLMNESLPTSHATLAYGASKAAAERLVLAANSPSLTTCALRPATIIGPGDSYGVVETIYQLIPHYETPFIIGDGHNMYDFVYISNAAYAHLLAVENLISSKTAAGLAMFISNQEPIYFRDFMAAIWAQCGGHVPPFQVRVPGTLAWVVGYVAEWVSWATGTEAALSRGSVQDAIGIRYADNSRAIEVLGYRPKVGFADAVAITCEDWKAKRKLEGKGR